MAIVSIIIPTFNRFTALNLAIQSVLQQTYQNIEIIVINDCSTEKEYYEGHLEKYPKTTVLHLPINLRKKYNVTAAQGKTRQEGINIAKGDWICFLDDDDYWYPNKLQTQLNELYKNPIILLCSSNMDVGYGIYSSTIKKTLYFKNQLPPIFDLSLIKKCNYINNSTVIIHKSIINQVGEFQLVTNEDYDYWLRALLYTNCLYIQEPLIYYDLGHANGKNYVYT